MALTAPFQSGKTDITTVVIVAFVILAIIGIVVGLKYSFEQRRQLSEDPNIKRIREFQIPTLMKRWVNNSQARGHFDARDSIPKDESVLINMNVFGARLGGYLGTGESTDVYTNGVFEEDAGVQVALGSGARCLVLEIDHYVEQNEPKLIYRDDRGIKRSLNDASLNKIARSLAGRVFGSPGQPTPPGLINAPFFLVLYFVSAPNEVEKPVEYVRFLARVAEQLKPIVPLLLTNTAQGDFRRQGMQSQMFYLDQSIFSKKIILMTNADTGLFQRLASIGLQGQITEDQDLDRLVHVRLTSPQSPSGLGITKAIVSNSEAPAACITTPQYWLNTPPDMLADAYEKTKKSWTLVLDPVMTSDRIQNKEKLDKLLFDMGVHCVPVPLFDKPSLLEPWVGKDAYYERAALRTKRQLIRWRPPQKIAIQKPLPQTDANGGRLIVPGGM